MPLPTGTISFSDVNTELGRNSTTAGSLEEAPVRTLAGKPTSQSTISMADLRGKANGLEMYIAVRHVNSDGSANFIRIYRGRNAQFSVFQEIMAGVAPLQGLAWSPDRKYLTHGRSAGNSAEDDGLGKFRTLKLDQNGFYTRLSELAFPNQPANNAGQYCSINKAGNLFTWVYSGSPDVWRYKLTNPSTDTWTLLGTLTTNFGYSVVYSPDENYLAIGRANNPWFAWYSRSGDTLTQLTTPEGDMFQCNYGLSWSNDSLYLAGGAISGQGGNTMFRAYSRSGNTLTRMTVTPTPTANTNGATWTAWSPTGTYLAVVRKVSSTSTDPSLSIYKRSGNTLTLLTLPTTQPERGTVQGVSWSADEKYIIVHYAGFDANFNPVMLNGRPIFYERSGDTFTAVGDGGLFGGVFNQPVPDANGCFAVWPRSSDGFRTS